MSEQLYQFLNTKGLYNYIHYDDTVENIAKKFQVSIAYVYKMMTDIEPNIQLLREQYKSQMIQELYDLCENGICLDIIWAEASYFNKLNYKQTIETRVLKQRLTRLFKGEFWDVPLLLTTNEFKHYCLRLDVESMLNQNMTQRAIAEQFNVGQSFVAKIKKEGALPLNISIYEQQIIRRNYKIIKGEQKIPDQKLMWLILKSRGVVNDNRIEAGV